MSRWLKEPLLHFLVAGALLFGAYAWISPPGQAKPPQVRIGEGEVRWLVQTWSRQWQREPTPEELRGLVTGLLKEELLSREAREMRLDEGDTIVRRRLAQKLEFLLRDTARPADPTEDELRRFHQSRPERFQGAARASFDQIYFSPQRRKDAAGDARAALERLSGPVSATAAALGDPSLVEARFQGADEGAVAAVFGPGFAREVMAIEPGAWRGPIVSGHGVHLVRVAEVSPARLRPFSEVREQVLEAWREERQREAEERYFRRLMEKYEVVVDSSVQPLVER